MKTTLLTTAAALVLLAGPALAGNTNNNSSSSSSSAYSSSQAANRNVNNNQQKLQPGAIGLPGLTSDLCKGSFSIGGGFPGGSLGIGMTTGDHECRAAYFSQILRTYGYRQQATQLMVNEIPMVQKAFQRPVAAGAAARQGVVVPKTPSCRQWVGGVVGGLCAY